MKTSILSPALLLSALAACSKPAAPPAGVDSAAAAAAAMVVSPTVAIAAAGVAKAIDAAPGKADSILTANQYTAESFERLLYAIAADSASAAAYKKAME